MQLADWLIRHLFIPGMGLWALLMIAREFGAFPSRRPQSHAHRRSGRGKCVAGK